MIQTNTDLDAVRLQYARLTRAVVHELRIPLQSLQGFAELIEPGMASARLERFMTLMRRDALRLSAVVDDLSLQSELDLGLVQLELRACAVEPLLLELAQALEMKFPELVVAVDCSEALPPALADEDRLRQLLERLLMNAARQAAADEPVIRLSAQVAARQVEFRVRDAGPLLPVDLYEEPLTPIPDVLATWGRMDLGLHTLRGLARHMGGELWIEPPDDLAHDHDQPVGNIVAVRLPTAAQESGDEGCLDRRG